MKKDLPDPTVLDDHFGCLGEFRIDDVLCNRGCAMRLRCAVEHNNNTRLEILEELVASEGIPIKIQ
jgi:hypothetical protein